MATLNPERMVSLGNTRGGELIRATIGLDGNPLSYLYALELWARVSPLSPMQKVSDATTWRLGGSPLLLGYAISDGSSQAERLKYGQSLTVFLDMTGYTAFEFRAAGSGSAFVVASPITTPVPSNQALTSNIRAHANWQTNGAALAMYQAAFGAWDDFTSARLLFLNHQAADATINNHIVGVGTTAYPSGTFNIATATWGAPAGAVTVPAATGSTAAERERQPGLILGPDLPAISLARADGEGDGGTNPLLFTRVLFNSGNAAGPLGDVGASYPTNYDPGNLGITGVLTAAPVAVDYVTTNQNGLAASGVRATTPVFSAFGAVFTYAHPVTSIMALGDSTMIGMGGDALSQGKPWSFLATARLRQLGKRVAYNNAGITGSTMPHINVRGKSVFNSTKPDIVLLHTYTTNAVAALSTQAEWDAQWQLVQDLVRTVQAAGKQPVLVTPLPFNTFTSATNLLRLKQLQRVMDSGLPYVNVEFLAAADGKFLYASDTSDGTHLTHACNMKIADAAVPVLASLIA